MRNRIKHDGKISLKIIKKLIELLIRKGIITKEELDGTKM